MDVVDGGGHASPALDRLSVGVEDVHAVMPKVLPLARAPSLHTHTDVWGPMETPGLDATPWDAIPVPAPAVPAATWPPTWPDRIPDLCLASAPGLQLRFYDNPRTKYSPLKDVEGRALEEEELGRLVELRRFTVPSAITFTFTAASEDALREAIGIIPPIVVVSSNRAAMLAQSATGAACAWLREGSPKAFDAMVTPEDYATVFAQGIPFPIFHPGRLPPDRHVVMVVRQGEFDAYRAWVEALGTHGYGGRVTLVGFRAETGANDDVPSLNHGFGLHRHCSLHLLKALGVPVAWFCDDTVVDLRALGAVGGLDAVEELLVPPLHAIGLQPMKTHRLHFADKGDVQSGLAPHAVTPSSPLADAEAPLSPVPPPGALASALRPARPLVEEVVLLRVPGVDGHLPDFSYHPMYIAGKEDMAYSALLRHLGPGTVPALVLSCVGIVKMEPPRVPPAAESHPDVFIRLMASSACVSVSLPCPTGALLPQSLHGAFTAYLALDPAAAGTLRLGDFAEKVMGQLLYKAAGANMAGVAERLYLSPLALDAAETVFLSAA